MFLINKPTRHISVQKEVDRLLRYKMINLKLSVQSTSSSPDLHQAFRNANWWRPPLISLGAKYLVGLGLTDVVNPTSTTILQNFMIRSATRATIVRSRPCELTLPAHEKQARCNYRIFEPCPTLTSSDLSGGCSVLTDAPSQAHF